MGCFRTECEELFYLKPSQVEVRMSLMMIGGCEDGEEEEEGEEEGEEEEEGGGG